MSRRLGRLQAVHNGSGGGGGGGGGGVPDVPGWTLLYDEEWATLCSEGSFLSTYAGRWAAYSAGTKDTYANQHGGTSQYATNNISVLNNGTRNYCNVRVYCDANGSYGAVLTPVMPGGTAYHSNLNRLRVEVQADCPSPVTWQKVAWMLWPDDNIWGDGEDDFPEATLSGQIQSNHHHLGSNASVADQVSNMGAFSGLHTYTQEWIGGTSIKYFLDGVQKASYTTNVATANRHHLLQIERQLNATPAPVVNQSCNVRIYYVRFWVPSS